MRRVLGVFLCMLLVFLFTNLCVAEAPKDIVFFNIPWGSSATEIADTLHPEIKFHFHETYMPLDNAFDSQIGTLFKWSCSEFKDGVRDYVYWFDNPQVKVAGYDLFGLSVDCMFDVENGKVVKDPERTRFYAGQYYIKNINSEAVYEDLLNKLNNQYGDGNEVSRKSDTKRIRVDGVSYEATKWKACTEWSDDHGAKILLVGNWLEQDNELFSKASYDDLLDEGEIYITYYLSNCNEAISEIDQIQRQEALELQQNSIDENNSDGL